MVVTDALTISPTLSLPIGLLVQKSAILARSGAGKTNGAVVIVEEMLRLHKQVVILDPPGAWWGLRSSRDGDAEGFPILIFGGEHQDLPLTADNGEEIAALLVQSRFSAILDLSELTGGEMTRFVEAFAKALYELKGPSLMRSPMMLVVEEADELAPQNSQPDQRRMLGAMERIAKRGRMRGIGLLMVTQRSASLNKNVLSQIEVLIAMQTTDPRDIKAIDAWLERQPDQSVRQRLLSEIASLQVGEAFVWSPSWLGMFEKMRFRRRTTFDSSATPDPSVEIADAPKAVATVADMLREMAPLLAMVDVHAGEDATQQEEIRRLHSELAQAHHRIAELEARPDPVIQIERVIAFDDASFQELQGMVGRFEAATSSLSGALARATADRLEAYGITALDGLDFSDAVLPVESWNIEGLGPLEKIEFPKNQRSFKEIQLKPESSTPVSSSQGANPKTQENHQSTPKMPTPTNPPDEVNPLGKAARLVLLALYQYKDGRSRSQISLLTGYSARSSTFGNALSELRVRGFLVDIEDRDVRITETGVAYGERAGFEHIVPSTRDQLRLVWLKKLGRAERATYEVIESAGGREVARGFVAEQSGYASGSSTFGNALSKLRTMDLIEGSKTLTLSRTVLSLIGTR